MNRRQLFGWLTALPFVPAALAKIAAPTLIKFPKPTANWGIIKLWDEALFAEYSRVNKLHRRFLEGDQWSLAEQEIFKRRNRTPLDLKYKPNLPEWF